MHFLSAKSILKKQNCEEIFVCDKKKFMQEMWNVGTTTAMYKERTKERREKNEPNTWAKENVQKAKEAMGKMGDDDVH